MRLPPGLLQRYELPGLLFRTFFFPILFGLNSPLIRPFALLLVRWSEPFGFVSSVEREIFNGWPDTRIFFKLLKITLGMPSGKSIML